MCIRDRINGFRRAFDKKGLRIKVTGVEPTMQFKPALYIDYDNEKADEILSKIMNAIEQTHEHNVLHEYEKEYKERKKQEKQDE